jgi:SAM-dependent methyltransferase
LENTLLIYRWKDSVNKGIFAVINYIMKKKPEEYILGISDYELERLRFQHGVWKEITDGFFDKLGIKEGWKILDVGAGPGFAAFDLRQRIGTTGAITALEPSEMYLDHFRTECSKNNWSNMHAVLGTVEDAEFLDNQYDMIFARWVIAFVTQPEIFLDRLCRALKLGGVIAIMDYAYEGLLLYPNGGAFDNMAETVRAYWKHGGGDPYIGAKLPKMFRERNIEITQYYPVGQCGSPDSGVFRWADKFFTVHVQQMVDLGIVSQKLGDEMLKDWIDHRNNPDSVFFSPTITAIAGKKKKP